MDRELKRSKKSGGENRDTVFRVRLTADEKQLIVELAKKYGFRNVSKYLRNLITNQSSTPSIDRQTLLLIHAELGKEGSNLNQIAKGINIQILHGREIQIDKPLFERTLDNVSKLTQQILSILKDGHFGKNKR